MSDFQQKILSVLKKGKEKKSHSDKYISQPDSDIRQMLELPDRKVK